MTIDGTDYVVVTGVNCRMRNYRCDNPINVNNPKAQVSFINCANKTATFSTILSEYKLLENDLSS